MERVERMKRSTLLIDASAIIADVKFEPGSEAVAKVIRTPPKGGLYMHAVNVCEVAYHLIKLGFPEGFAYKMAIPRNVTVIDEIVPEVWKRAASLKAKHKNLALGDCIAIAQAELLNADILTGDRGFQEVDTPIEITLFR